MKYERDGIEFWAEYQKIQHEKRLTLLGLFLWWFGIITFCGLFWWGILKLIKAW